MFTTQDRDIFLPAEPQNLLAAWRACEASGLELSSGGEPLDVPRDQLLAERIVEHRVLTHATDHDELQVDLTLVMKGFEFDEVWAERKSYLVAGVAIPVARLAHIVRSKRQLLAPEEPED